MASASGTGSATGVRQREGDDVGTRRDRNELAPVERVRHRRGTPAVVRRKAPQRPARGAVGGNERAGFVAVEHGTCRGRERAAPTVAGTGLNDLPFDRPGPPV